MERLFEPFFTTRGPVDVSSSPGQGNCFTLWLPRPEEPLAQGGPIPPRRPSPRKARASA